MAAASLLGVLIEGLYHDDAWGREAFRGGDVVTLALAAPMLAVSLLLVARGSRRAVPVWIGMLLYAVYNYAYAVFGAAFNDAFILHIAILSASIFALACALPQLDLRAVVWALRDAIAVRTIGVFLALVGVLQGGLWAFLLIRNIATGELIADVPVAGQHLVFALDLGLLAPSLVLAGILLFRHTPFGFVFGPAMAVMGAVYQLNLMLAGVFQDRADVAGVKAFPPESIFLTATFVVAALLLLWPRRTAARA